MDAEPRSLNFETHELVLNGQLLTKDTWNQILDVEQLDEISLKVISFLEQWWDNRSFVSITTSGSTGTPKTLHAEKQNLWKSAEKTIEWFGLKQGMTALLCLSPDYIAGKMMIVRAMQARLNLITTNLSANPLAALNQPIHFVAMVPLQLVKVLEESPEKLKLVQTILLGGSGLSIALEDQLQSISTNVFHSYGMTETLSHIALRAVNGIQASDWFQPMKQVQISRNENGCLVAKVPFLSADAIVTHDVIEMSENGSFKVIGRADDVIVSAGNKIHPALLEKKMEPILHFPFLISSKPNPASGEELVLLIEKELSISTVFVLWNQLFSNLEPFEIPRLILFVPKIPLLESGKVNRLAAKQLASKL